jgi:hypothetical protein
MVVSTAIPIRGKDERKIFKLVSSAKTYALRHRARKRAAALDSRNESDSLFHGNEDVFASDYEKNFLSF